VVNWFKRKLKKKKVEPNFTALVEEFKIEKEKLDLMAHIVFTEESEHLVEQTEEFYEKLEFAYTSFIQCLSASARYKIAMKLREKIKEVK